MYKKRVDKNKLFLNFTAVLLNENYSAYWARSLLDNLLVTYLSIQLIFA